MGQIYHTRVLQANKKYYGMHCYNTFMSTFNDIDITCEECGEEFKGIVWTAIHAQQDPELKDLLLGGELNLLMCPKCSHVAFQDYFVLYQDPTSEIVAYIYPPAQEQDAEFLQKSMLANFAEAQAIYKPKERKDYSPLLVFGLESFVRMMEREELRNEQSDIAEAICKEHLIPFHKLRPSKARQLRIMQVIPSAQQNATYSRENILNGLELLLQQNPTLDYYKGLRDTIEKDPQWRFPQS
jgi:hypothetical protein